MVRYRSGPAFLEPRASRSARVPTVRVRVRRSRTLDALPQGGHQGLDRVRRRRQVLIRFVGLTERLLAREQREELLTVRVGVSRRVPSGLQRLDQRDGEVEWAFIDLARRDGRQQGTHVANLIAERTTYGGR